MREECTMRSNEVKTNPDFKIQNQRLDDSFFLIKMHVPDKFKRQSYQYSFTLLVQGTTCLSLPEPNGYFLHIDRTLTPKQINIFLF